MKSMILGLLAVGALTAFDTEAAAVECYVDTQAYDQYTAGHCFSMVWGARTATAVFRVNGANGQISQVIWGDAASGKCGSGTHCSFTIRPFRPYRATATILYADGTWENATPATASFEDGR
ncbi:hypothetical protein L2750_08825 [Shewanella submarina]|uniref:Pullulanase n=1 Tax=Shewanella submarina TaxID=2016376 RepID=A0ABV7G9G2_9GAMM|nr:hypothetical protein [Shewanella submarina]MCL1037256.1 hypothetical protein [Shewanella submarina]